MSSFQRVGLHVSAAGGVEHAPDNAKGFGAEVFQFFSRSPRGGQAPPVTQEQARLFKARCEEYGLESYIHTPYYINFASKKKTLAQAAIRIVQEELERASALGVKYVVTHLGSAKDFPLRHPPSLKLRGTRGFGGQAENVGQDGTPNEALNQTIAGLKDVFAGSADFSAILLLEISAGAGAVIGDTFEELAYILTGLGRRDVHVCLDTCHLFASGYDIRTKESWHKTMQQFRHTIGISRLKLMHVNDSKVGLGGHVDRHEHLGKGTMGLESFRVLFSHPDLKEVNFVLETPHDTVIKQDIELLKRFRDS